jgi:hypothetical protein
MSCRRNTWPQIFPGHLVKLMSAAGNLGTVASASAWGPLQQHYD